MKYINSILLNSGMMALLYFGYIKGVEPCQNAAHGLAITMGILGALLFFGQINGCESPKSHIRPDWFRNLDMTFDLVVVGFMFAYGNPVAGALMVVSLIACRSATAPKEGGGN